MTTAIPVESAQHGRGGAWPPAKSIYALRACIALATSEPGARMKAQQIAQAAAVPKGFLSKILGELRAAGIVSAQRGYHGGYRLTRPASAIAVHEVLRAVGTRDPFATNACDDTAPLPFIVDLLNRLQALAVEALQSASLAEIAAAGIESPAPTEI
jgi:Rrf2 family protein